MEERKQYVMSRGHIMRTNAEKHSVYPQRYGAEVLYRTISVDQDSLCKGKHQEKKLRKHRQSLRTIIFMRKTYTFVLYCIYFINTHVPCK